MTMEVEMENIAGIREGSATVEPGINAIQGSNWRGKSSFIAALETVMGTITPLTVGAERGRVTLTTAERTVVAELVRRDGEVVREGECYLAEERERVVAELFAFLDETNPVRTAVRNGDDLEELLTRPLDFEDIDERIAEHNREREQVERELERARTAAEQLPRQESAVAELASTLEALREERDELVDGGDADRAGGATRDELSDLRAERDRVRDRIDRLEDTIDRTRDRLGDRREELEALAVPADADLESELAAARDELQAIERDVELLQSVYESNRRVLDEGRVELLTQVDHGMLDDTLECWLCGEAADRAALESALEALGDRIASRREAAAANRERVAELDAKREAVREKRRRKADLEAEISELESTLADREESLTTARDRLAELDDRVEALAADVEDADDRLTDIESEIKYTERSLEEAEDELEALESAAARRETLEAEREDLAERIEALRNRKDRTKRRTREAFDEAIEAVLSRFDVGFETARLTAGFDLVVAREGREAPLETLSEGERELLGIVAALAGHAAFDVGDDVPVLLLDGLGGLAKEHLHVLVDYLEDRAAYLVLTAYPEHGRFEGQQLDPTEWTVVADDRDALATG